MTICIACACESSQSDPTKGKIVTVSDRMITAEYLMLEFEHALPKIEEITSSSLVMLAGDALAPTDVIRDVRSEARKEKVTEIRALANLIAQSLADHRKRLVTENVLRRRGLNSFDEYYERASALPSDLVSTLDTEIAAFEDIHELGDVEILLAGMDATGPHLYLISKPGTSTCFDAIGYHAIGSGEQQAIATISSYGYVDAFNTNTASYIAYEAKRKAERAPGVGRETDIRLINSKGIHEISPAQMSRLEETYQTKVTADSKWLEALPDFGLP